VRVRSTWVVLVALVLPTSAGATTNQVVATRDVGAALAVDDLGRAFLVTPRPRDGSAAFASVRVRSAAPGARFGRSRAMMRATRADRVADTGVDAAGRGVVVVESADRVGVGQPAHAISPAGADFAASAVARTGAAVVVWFHHREGGRWRLEASVRDRGSAAFGRAQPVSRWVRRVCCTSVSAAIGERGDAAVTWSSTVRPAVWASLRRPGRRFGRPQRLSREAADIPKAVVGADGAAVVLYSTQHVPRRASDGLQVHRARSTGRFDAAEHVTSGGGVTIADAALAPSGALTVAWVDQVHGARVHVSEAPGDGPLTPVADLGTTVAQHGIAVANDDNGRAVVAWSERSAEGERPHAAIRPAAGATFGPPVALGRSWRAAEPELARLVPGGALVLWRGSRYGPPAARRTALAVARLP
jgi:hypothetical protein